MLELELVNTMLHSRDMFLAFRPELCRYRGDTVSSRSSRCRRARMRDRTHRLECSAVACPRYQERRPVRTRAAFRAEWVSEGWIQNSRAEMRHRRRRAEWAGGRVAGAETRESMMTMYPQNGTVGTIPAELLPTKAGALVVDKGVRGWRWCKAKTDEWQENRTKA